MGSAKVELIRGHVCSLVWHTQDFNPQCFSLVVEYLRNRRLRQDDSIVSFGMRGKLGVMKGFRGRVEIHFAFCLTHSVLHVFDMYLLLEFRLHSPQSKHVASSWAKRLRQLYLRLRRPKLPIEHISLAGLQSGRCKLTSMARLTLDLKRFVI